MVWDAALNPSLYRSSCEFTAQTNPVIVKVYFSTFTHFSAMLHFTTEVGIEMELWAKMGQGTMMGFCILKKLK